MESQHVVSASSGVLDLHVGGQRIFRFVPVEHAFLCDGIAVAVKHYGTHVGDLVACHVVDGRLYDHADIG